MTHPLISAALRAHRGETSERFGVSVPEVAAMRAAVLAVLREMRNSTIGDRAMQAAADYSDLRDCEPTLYRPAMIDAFIKEIEG